MLQATSTPETPWQVVLANDKRRARIEILRSVLHAIDYDGKDAAAVGEIDDRIVIDPQRYIHQHSDS
jgi:hypothetical protein